MWLEKDVFLKLAGTDEARVFVTKYNDFQEICLKIDTEFTKNLARVSMN